MSDKIEEIKARHNAAEIDSIHQPGKAHDDRAVLLAEVERLRGAVRWYGNRACGLSEADNKYPFSDLFEDAGKRAREALKGGR